MCNQSMLKFDDKFVGIMLLALFLAVVITTAVILWKLLSTAADKVTDNVSGDPLEEGFDDGSGEIEVQYFSMTGCPHCKKFDPVWKSVSEYMKGYDGKQTINMHKWDVKTPDGKKKAQEEGITAFPHVQKVADGETVVFDGKRTESDLKDFCLA